MRDFLLLLASLTILSHSVVAQHVHEPHDTNPDWSKPYTPFRIAGNLYYVGTYELACYLVVTPQGNILINTGLASSAPIIKNNIEKLGFKFSDIKILLTTQAHFDHVGAMASVKKMTGATLMADEKDVAVLADGGSSDYAFGDSGSTFQPVKTDRVLHDRDTIQLGDAQLVMLHHPGHTKGSCSFLLTVKDNQQSYRVLIANMPTIVVEKSFNDIATYPNIAEDYAYTLNALKTISFDLWVASHASQFYLHKKHKPSDAYNPTAFRDQQGFDEEISDLQKQYDQKIAQP
ncbi:subclass B3 metallo-beta-lactamase [Ohtaekwangia sp.]|uniref:subclass B3 metallo-beta-lactamase n=1 Tax=Ohtaekwangia sp. TaxID=2066019 RepID=UPI002FDEA6D7